jgi:hypothetical protein
MSSNIYSILDDDINDDEIEKLKTSNVSTHFNKQVNFDLEEQEVILPIKKKKGRKSKKDKQLELEALERNKVPPKLFPNLNEKIFDVIEIKGKEYFLDTNFNIIYDDETNQVGIKRKNEYIIYSDFGIDKIESQLELDDKEVEHIIKLLTKKNI